MHLCVAPLHISGLHICFLYNVSVFKLPSSPFPSLSGFPAYVWLIPQHTHTMLGLRVCVDAAPPGYVWMLLHQGMCGCCSTRVCVDAAPPGYVWMLLHQGMCGCCSTRVCVDAAPSICISWHVLVSKLCAVDAALCLPVS